MSLLLLLFLMLACLPIDWPDSLFATGPQGSAALTGGIVACLLVTARLFTGITIRGLLRHPDDREAISRAHGVRRLLFFFLNLGGYALVLLCCGWGATVHKTLTIGGHYLPGAELAVLAPYLVALIGSWAIFYDAERVLHQTSSNPAIRGEFWSRRGYVLFLLRHHVLTVFAPVLLMIFQLGLLRAYPDLLASPYSKLVAFVGLFAFILLIPSLVPLVLGLRPMPPGRLRDQLEVAAKRLGVRYRNLYIWDTRGNMATAMVTGLVPRLRQIVFTDLLLATLAEDEIEAVFGHEVGHVRHGHLLYYAGFLMLSFLTLGAVYRTIDKWVVSALPNENYLLVLSVLLTGSYLFVVFGFISRRCERQADVFGCKAVSCTDPACVSHGIDTPLVPGGRSLCPSGVATFVRALERVEEINGMARGSVRASQGGVFAKLGGLVRLVGVCLATWQHSTITKRVEFLKTLSHDPHREKRFQRRVSIVRWGLVAVLVVGFVVIGELTGWRSLLEGM